MRSCKIEKSKSIASTLHEYYEIKIKNMLINYKTIQLNKDRFQKTRTYFADKRIYAFAKDKWNFFKLSQLTGIIIINNFISFYYYYFKNINT